MLRTKVSLLLPLFLAFSLGAGLAHAEKAESPVVEAPSTPETPAATETSVVEAAPEVLPVPVELGKTPLPQCGDPCSENPFQLFQCRNPYEGPGVISGCFCIDNTWIC